MSGGGEASTCLRCNASPDESGYCCNVVVALLAAPIGGFKDLDPAGRSSRYPRSLGVVLGYAQADLLDVGLV